jgi:hypothetical protein
VDRLRGQAQRSSSAHSTAAARCAWILTPAAKSRLAQHLRMVLNLPSGFSWGQKSPLCSDQAVRAPQKKPFVMHHTSVVTTAVGLSFLVASLTMPRASAHQVMSKDNPTTGELVGLPSVPSGWYADEGQAVADDGPLAAIHSQTEQDWLVQELSYVWSVSFNVALQGPWSGLNDAAQHSNWVYSSGEPAACYDFDPRQGSSPVPGTAKNCRLLAFGFENWRRDDPAGCARPAFIEKVPKCPARARSWTHDIDSLQAQAVSADGIDGDVWLLVVGDLVR